MPTINFTKSGFEKIQKELETLIEKRKSAVENLKRAREMGDLSENGFYKAAKMELGAIERRTREILYQIKFGKVIANTNKNQVGIGSLVRISDGQKEFTYTIVGDYEADPKANHISIKSPIGKALLNKKVEEKVIVKTPSGNVTYKIQQIGIK